MSNLRGSPLFLRPSVVRGLIEASDILRKGTVAVPIAPIKLVDRPRRSDDPRLAKANDDLPANAPVAHEAKKSGRVAPPVASEPVPVPPVLAQEEPEDWPDAPLPEHADPDLDRGEPVPEAEVSEQISKGHDTPLPQLPVRNVARRKRDQLYYQNREQDARELEQPVDRIALIREAARRSAASSAPTVAARPSLGIRHECQPVAIPPMPFEQRRKALDAAIAHLKREAIVVCVVDRNAQVRKYWVSGKRDPKFAEEVIEIATQRGMELPA